MPASSYAFSRKRRTVIVSVSGLRYCSSLHSPWRGRSSSSRSFHSWAGERSVVARVEVATTSPWKRAFISNQYNRVRNSLGSRGREPSPRAKPGFYLTAGPASRSGEQAGRAHQALAAASSLRFILTLPLLPIAPATSFSASAFKGRPRRRLRDVHFLRQDLIHDLWFISAAESTFIEMQRLQIPFPLSNRLLADSSPSGPIFSFQPLAGRRGLDGQRADGERGGDATGLLGPGTVCCPAEGAASGRG
jgi:hypothetical protein